MAIIHKLSSIDDKQHSFRVIKNDDYEVVWMTTIINVREERSHSFIPFIHQRLRKTFESSSYPSDNYCTTNTSYRGSTTIIHQVDATIDNYKSWMCCNAIQQNHTLTRYHLTASSKEQMAFIQTFILVIVNTMTIDHLSERQPIIYKVVWMTTIIHPCKLSSTW